MREAAACNAREGDGSEMKVRACIYTKMFFRVIFRRSPL